MRVFVLELVGMASFITAGFLVSPSVGLVVIGVLCMASAFVLARSVSKDDAK